MPKVKLLGGIADGAIAYVAPDVDEIYIPKEWARRDHRPIRRAEFGAASDQARYVRRDHETFVAEGTDI